MTLRVVFIGPPWRREGAPPRIARHRAQRPLPNASSSPGLRALVSFPTRPRSGAFFKARPWPDGCRCLGFISARDAPVLPAMETGIFHSSGGGGLIVPIFIGRLTLSVRRNQRLINAGAMLSPRFIGGDRSPRPSPACFSARRALLKRGCVFNALSGFEKAAGTLLVVTRKIFGERRAITPR